MTIYREILIFRFLNKKSTWFIGNKQVSTIYQLTREPKKIILNIEMVNLGVYYCKKGLSKNELEAFKIMAEAFLDLSDKQLAALTENQSLIEVFLNE